LKSVNLPALSGVLMACDRIERTRFWPIVFRNNDTLTARPPQLWQTQKMPAFSGVRVNPLPQVGQLNMAVYADYRRKLIQTQSITARAATPGI